jgi:hypothetical protein
MKATQRLEGYLLCQLRLAFAVAYSEEFGKKSTLMKSAEYRVTSADKIHRLAAFFSVIGVIVFFINGFDSLRGLRAGATVIFPFTAIWFADDLAHHVSKGSGGWISPIRAPSVLRWAAWFCMGSLFFFAWSSLKGHTPQTQESKFRDAVSNTHSMRINIFSKAAG